MNSNLSISQLDFKTLKLVFHQDIEEMPFNDLGTEMNEDFLNNYLLVKLNIQKVISKINGGKKRYNKFCLDKKMQKLIEFINAGNRIIPPVIINITADSWEILDGQHRIALCVYLNVLEIPFLVRKQHLNFIKELHN